MRTRMLPAVLAFGLALLASPVSADVSASAALHQNATIWASSFDETGWFDGYFTISSDVGGGNDDTIVDFVATASVYRCEFTETGEECSGGSFPTQIVPPDALTMDPLGNSATIDACLVPTSGGACHTFELTLVRPQYLSPGFICFPNPVCTTNAWYDSDTGEAFARAQWAPAIVRSGYTVSGTWDDEPFDTSTDMFVQVDTRNQLVVDAWALLP